MSASIAKAVLLFIGALVLIGIKSAPALAQPLIAPEIMVYRVVGRDSLTMAVFPLRQQQREALPGAVLFFHGGAWDQGTPTWERFCGQMLMMERVCELHVFPNAGHNLGLNLAVQDRDYVYDPTMLDDAHSRQIHFLLYRGYDGRRSR